MKPIMADKEMFEAVISVLYHHPRSSPMITSVITHLDFTSYTPPQPTENQAKLAHDAVEELLTNYHNAFREACKEVLGEDPEEWVN
jgi:hypothetical protein